jgi:mono/diheme cytochrome c family protein
VTVYAPISILTTNQNHDRLPPRSSVLTFKTALFSLALSLAGYQLPVAIGADFESSVKPLLEANCSPCHNDATRTSGFSIATEASVLAGGNRYGKAVQAGHSEQSVIIQILQGRLSPRMPMGKILPDAEVARIAEWIRSLPSETGVHADTLAPARAWAFRAPADAKIPAVRNSAWVRNPIDAFILEKLEAKDLTPAPQAAKRTLARRLYFDLIGMPPSPEELNAFLSDPSSDSYEKLVDRLLADPRYGERWGRHWLDLVRYSETEGLEGDAQLGRSRVLQALAKTGGNPWRYRDWVIDAFNNDMPYNRFALLQIGGGDEQSKTRSSYEPDIRNYVALGYLRMAPWDVEDFVSEQQRQAYLNEVTATTSSVFLGVSLGCAQCHDHKYDPIPSRDFYRFQAFFNSIYVNDVEVPFADHAFREKAEAKIRYYTERLKDGPERKALDDYEKALLAKLISLKIAEAAKRDLDAQDLRLELHKTEQKIFTPDEQSRHAELSADFNRTGDPEQKDALDAYEKILLPKLRDGYARKLCDPLDRFRQLTVEDVRRAMPLDGAELKYFAAAEAEKWQKLTDEIEILERRLARWRPIALSVTNVTGPPVGPPLPQTHVLVRGDFRQPGEVVEPGFPSAITGNSDPAVIESDRYRQFATRGRRITLAHWIASPDNPLTARVMVNRIWQYHFGRGIVGTPNDFGRNGDPPSHADLLDWLARRFMEQGWSIKAMHRLILNSNAYRQSADNSSALAVGTKIDPENRLLWHFSRQRLDAEEVRDSILFLSGRLNLERGGPSVFPALPEELADLAKPVPIGGLQWEPNENEEDARRRSVYVFQRRSIPLPMMAVFDATVFNETCPVRSATTTPLQALTLMNGSLVNEEAGYLAARVKKDAGDDRQAQVARLFEIVFNRAPDSSEAQRMATFQGSLEALCRVVLNSNELMYVE